MKNDPYKKAGVDIKAGNDLVDKIRKDVASTFDKNVLGGIGSFSGFYSLPKGFKNPVLVACTDGVGTKVALARATLVPTPSVQATRTGFLKPLGRE